MKANKEAIAGEHRERERELLKNAPEAAWQRHGRVKVAVGCEVSWLVSNVGGKRCLAGSTDAPHEVNATPYSGSLRHRASARVRPRQEVCTDHVRAVGSLGGAPRGVHRRHEAGCSDTPRGVCVSQIPPRPRPHA